MHHPPRRFFAAFAVLLVCAAAPVSFADTNTKTRFDLHAESLDQALRDLALQADCNISYDPTLVAGVMAPAVKGEFLPSDALSRILKSTRLKSIKVDGHTLQILAADASQSKQIVAPALPVAGGEASGEAGGTVAAESRTAQDAAARKKDLEEIVVTGTHLRGEHSASPMIEIGQEEIERSGYTSIADVVRSLPQNFGGGTNPSTIVNNSQINNAYGDNPTGASEPNLRGLGPGSTLTLIDGHRMASGLPGGGADISSIPLDAVERVEVLTDSASSIYGSDAVAGVVNVILKQHYDGAKTSLSYGLAPEGGGTQKRISQIFGTTWNTGHAMIGYEHAQQGEVDSRDRSFTSSAGVPNTLLPYTQSNALTVSAKQTLWNSISLFVDGLYVNRDAKTFSYSPGNYPALVTPAGVRRFELATGVDIAFASDWKSAVFVNDAEDRTREAYFLVAPPTTPYYAESLLGISRGIEANANGKLVELPTGPMSLAVGLGYRKESFSEGAGLTSSTLSSLSTGARDIRYTFGELSLPLVARSNRAGLNYLDIVMSGRTERYSDVGGSTSPKVGVVYGPSKSLKLRSTWGRAFRAPNLYDMHGTQSIAIFELTDPSSPTGTSQALVPQGGNPGLKPEKATAWTLGADYSPEWLDKLRLSVTAFDIRYKNRITQIGNLYAALSDPVYAGFVTPSPSAAYAQALVNQYPADQVNNYTSGAFSPQNITAVVDDRMVNVARQTARGIDLTSNYSFDPGIGIMDLFLNGAYMDLTQQDSPTSPTRTLSGLAFYAPKFHFQGGATWKVSDLAYTVTTNYVSHEINGQVTPAQYVASWTTLDSSVRYAPRLKGMLSGLNLNLAVINIANRNPPYVQSAFAGLNYDPTNTSALGRYVTLQVSKEW